MLFNISYQYLQVLTSYGVHPPGLCNGTKLDHLPTQLLVGSCVIGLEELVRKMPIEKSMKKEEMGSFFYAFPLFSMHESTPAYECCSIYHPAPAAKPSKSGMPLTFTSVRLIKIPFFHIELAAEMTSAPRAPLPFQLT